MSTLPERIADLNPQWRYAITKADRDGWEIFPCNDRVPTTPTWPKDKTDWSKRPRRRCPACKAAMDNGIRGSACLQQCGHGLCHGLLGATNDIGQLIDLARQFPNANTAVRTGQASNLFGLDIDGPEGEKRIADLQAEHDELNPTLRHQTGGGTWHHLFNYPTDRQNPTRPDGEWRNNAGTLLGKGLDTRGEGGYLLLPHSNTRKGPYRVNANLPQGGINGWVLDLLGTTPERNTDKRERRASARATASAVDFSGATNGLHPYAAAAFTNRIGEFRALTGTGNGRTNLLTGGAKYLSGIANHPPESGLTEDMIRDGFTEACHANGYAHAHSDWEYQLGRGLADGRGVTPQNWPPPEPVSEVDRLLANVLANGDQEQIELLTAALGPEEIRAFRARTQRATPAAVAATPAAVAPTPVAVAATPPQTSRAAAPASTPHPPATEATKTIKALEAIEAAAVTTKPSTATPQPGDIPYDTTLARTGRTMVDVGTKDKVRDFSDTRKDIQLALGVSNAVSPWLYEHGGEMVVAGRGKLQRVNVDILTSRLANRIEFIHWGKDENQQPITRTSNPPTPVIKAIHADRANIGLPEVDRIAHTPFFGPYGILQRKPGYHPMARTLYVPTPGVDIPDIPDNPTAQQVNEAVELILDELLGDFPFTSDAERAGAVALGITPFVRTMIDGPTPLFALDAPEPRTGKGLLMEMLLVPSSGRQYTVTPAPTELREWHKAIVASLRPGPVAAVFDNANARIDSGALASAVTAYPAYTSRLLGLSENVDMPLPAVWVMTGNNIVCSTEIAGRVVRIRLDARAERPGERTGFRHPNLRRWATAHQGDIIAAFLTMVQAWIAAGQPRATGLPTMGGFEDWVQVVGSILAFHGIGGLLDNREQLIDTMTDDSTDWSGLIGMMVTETAEAHKRAEEAAEKAAEKAAAPDDTPEPAVPGDPDPATVQPFVASFGSKDTPALATPPDPATGAGGDPATPADPAGQRVGEWTASQLVSLMLCSGVQSPVDFGITENSNYQARKLAKALRAHRDRRFGDHTLRMRILHGKTLWSLEGMA